MTEKELKRLSRMELLGLLLDEVRRNEALETKVKDLQERLEDRSALNSARAAAEQYEEGIQKLTARQDEFLAKLAEGIPSQDVLRQISENIEHIMKEQEQLRNQIASGGKGARR